MNKSVKTNIISFSDVKVSEEPYQHIEIQEFFNPKYAMDILEWLEEGENFVSQTSDFYEQSMFPVTPKNLPEHLQGLLSQESLSQVREYTEKAFQVKFNERVIVTAHRLVPGQQTGIHNDYHEDPHSLKYGFTHRIVVYLNDNWVEEFGGLLGIYTKTKCLHKSIPPINNTAAGFTFGMYSYHDISEVVDKTRYTINYTFLSKK